jgi:hypothetical protein
MELSMLEKLLVFALTSGLAARATQAWLARSNQRRGQAATKSQASDEGRWADDGGRVLPPVQRS